MPTDKEWFERWLDGEAVDEKVIARWQQDESLKDHYDTGLYLQHQADCYENQAVPRWDREATFGYEKPPSRWAAWFNNSPALSMAFSIAAILMVLFKVELQINDNGVLLTFGQASNQQMLNQLDERLVQYSRDQQLVMANYVNDIQAQQKQDMTQLASYLVESARTERREDITELVKYINDRREDDLTLQKYQIDKILYRYNQKSSGAELRPMSYQQPVKQSTQQEEK